MLTVDDIIRQAHALVSEPVDVSDIPDDADPEIVEDAIMSRERARVDKFLGDRNDRLVMLRRIREASLAMAARYKEEAKRWDARAKRRERLADYCAELALHVLVVERQAAGVGIDQPYKIELEDGSKIGIRVTKVVYVSDLDELPGKYVRVSRAADKVEIAKRLKAGEAVSGAKLVTNEHVDWGR